MWTHRSPRRSRAAAFARDLPSRRPSRVTRPSCALIASLCALQRRKDKLPVSKLLLGFFVFVIFGSTLLQLINKVAK